jgi:hypothetical protein
MSEHGTGAETSAPLPPPAAPPFPPPAGPSPPPPASPAWPPPVGARQQPPPTRAWWKSPWLIAGAALLALAVVVGVILVATNSDETESAPVASSSLTTLAPATAGPTSVPTTTAPSTTEQTTTAATTTTVATTTTATPTTPAPTIPTVPPGPLPSFGAGTKVVGADIRAGRYLSLGGPACYFARLRDLSGTIGGIIANENPVGEAIVDIAPTDAAFQSRGCSDWVAFLGGDPHATFGDGEWQVNTHVAPGRWQAPGGNGCYWARTKDFSHTPEGIIANDNPTGPVVVDILRSDSGFTTRRCGTWTKVG